MSTTWTQLRSAAMLGLARRPLDGLDIDGVRPVANAGPGAAFLAAAALAGTQRRAGRVITGSVTVPPAAADERQPVASASATQLLELVLGGALGRPADSRPLLAHWLHTAAATGRIVPPTMAVTLLDRAATMPDLQPHIAAVVGERGRWLAAQRDDWAAVLAGVVDADDGDADDGGATGTGTGLDALGDLPKTARLARLQEARRTDATGTREWIESHWEQGKAADRSIHVAALHVGLDADDEPLLERALDDRSVAVREAAAGVLDRLPSSARGRRLGAVLGTLIERPGRLRRKLTVAALPADLDLGRDLPGRALGATLLRNLIAAAPLSTWSEVTGLGPAELLRHQTDPADVAELWVVAAVQQLDVAWLWALIAHEPVLPQVGRALVVVPGPWTAEQSRSAIATLRRHKHAATLLDSCAANLTEHLHESAVADLEHWRSRLGADDTAIDRRLRTLLQHLSTRRSITEAFT